MNKRINKRLACGRIVLAGIYIAKQDDCDAMRDREMRYQNIHSSCSIHTERNAQTNEPRAHPVGYDSFARVKCMYYARKSDEIHRDALLPRSNTIMHFLLTLAKWSRVLFRVAVYIQSDGLPFHSLFIPFFC